MEIQTTATFDELFLKLPRKIQIKADEKTTLFRENPFNTVLRTEKLHPKGYDVRGGRVCLDSLKRFLSGKLPCLMPLPASEVV